MSGYITKQARPQEIDLLEVLCIPRLQPHSRATGTGDRKFLRIHQCCAALGARPMQLGHLSIGVLLAVGRPACTR